MGERLLQTTNFPCVVPCNVRGLKVPLFKSRFLRESKNETGLPGFKFWIKDWAALIKFEQFKSFF